MNFSRIFACSEIAFLYATRSAIRASRSVLNSVISARIASFSILSIASTMTPLSCSNFCANSSRNSAVISSLASLSFASIASLIAAPASSLSAPDSRRFARISFAIVASPVLQFKFTNELYYFF